MVVKIYYGFWSRDLVQKDKEGIYVFGDNFADSKNLYIPSSTQACIRGLSNAFGISTKHSRFTRKEDYFNNEFYNQFEEYFKNRLSVLRKLGENKIIYLPNDGIGSGKAFLNKKAPLIFNLIQDEFNNLLGYEHFIKCCPFCGSLCELNIIDSQTNLDYSVECQENGHNFNKYFESKEEAIREWNKRI